MGSSAKAHLVRSEHVGGPGLARHGGSRDEPTRPVEQNDAVKPMLRRETGIDTAGETQRVALFAGNLYAPDCARLPVQSIGVDENQLALPFRWVRLWDPITCVNMSS